MQILMNNQPIEPEDFIKGVFIVAVEMFKKNIEKNSQENLKIQQMRNFALEILEGCQERAPDIAEYFQGLEQDRANKQATKTQQEILTTSNSM